MGDVVSLAEHRQKQLPLFPARLADGREPARPLSPANVAHRARMLEHLVRSLQGGRSGSVNQLCRSSEFTSLVAARRPGR
jgi:hypothetical protein